MRVTTASLMSKATDCTGKGYASRKSAPLKRARFFLAQTSLVVMLVCAVLMFFELMSLRRDAIRLLPIVLHSRRKLIYIRKESRYLPHILFAQGPAPGGHSGISNSGSDSVINMPIGIIHGLQHQLRWRRIQ